MYEFTDTNSEIILSVSSPDASPVTRVPEKIKYNNYDGVIEKVEPEADPHVVLPNQPSDQHHVVVQQQTVAQPAPTVQPEPEAQQPVAQTAPAQQVVQAVPSVQPNTQVVQNLQGNGTNVQ